MPLRSPESMLAMPRQPLPLDSTPGSRRLPDSRRVKLQVQALATASQEVSALHQPAHFV